MDKDLFFLGSGFSKAIDNSFPTLKELTNEINQNFKYEKTSVAMHFHNEIPKQYKDNIELLLTFLSSNLPYKTDVQVSVDEALYKDIAQKITEYFYLKNKQDKIKEYFNKTSSLIKYIFENKLSCITLNYDLLLEALIHEYTSIYSKQNVCMYKCLYKMPIQVLLSRTHNGLLGDSIKYDELPTISKLHGSINWLYDGEINNNIVYCESEKTAEPNQEEMAKIGLKRLIVAPTLDKTNSYNNNFIKTIWKRSYDELQKAKNIYIIGFSFPPTDLSIRFLMQSALSNNCNNPQIYVINTQDAINPKSENHIKERYKNIFKGYKINFDYCCQDSLNKFTQDIIETKLKQ